MLIADVLLAMLIGCGETINDASFEIDFARNNRGRDY